MATIYPAQPDPAAPLSERRVFERLRDRLPSDWTVLHARRIALASSPGQGAFEGEVDFVVVNPEWGWLGLEVKGGGVCRTDSAWSSTDREGKIHPITDPGRQAQRAVHAIRRYLTGHPEAHRIAFGWGVVLPDIEVSGDLGPELPRALIVDRRDLDHPREALRNACTFFQADAGPVTRDVQRRFLAAMDPRILLVPSLSSRIEEGEAVLVRLTDEQTRILDVLSEVPRLVVKGAAGTGKTLVAMEKARRLASEGKRVLLLCFNKLLAEFLAQRADGFTVKHFHGLCRELATAAGIPFRLPKDSAAAKEYWEMEPPQQLMRALEAFPDRRFDAVIVDEGQDFREYWWVAVEKLLEDPRGGTLWVFFDPLQNLFGGGPTEVLGLTPASLTWNCRNTRRIATFASAFVAATPNLREGTPEGVVEEIVCATEREMLETVRTSLDRLVSEGKIPSDRIVVLTPGSMESSVVWKHRRFGNLALVTFPDPPGPGEVSFATLRRFKGLEADVIILCEVRDGDAVCTPNHLYVGTSRARHVLIVAKYGGAEGRAKAGSVAAS